MAGFCCEQANVMSNLALSTDEHPVKQGNDPVPGAVFGYPVCTGRIVLNLCCQFV